MSAATMKTLALAIALAATVGLAQAADLDAARKLAETNCASCHGKDGKTPTDPSYPILAGQHADYLYKALLDYQTGDRKNPIMGAMAKPLSKADMQNLSAYFESLPGPLTTRK
jgi:cytochrome c553